jgi:Ni2+-binding GTPase involved in maturation of urease and hydrogenase
MFTGRVDPVGVIGSYFANKAKIRRVFVIHGLGGAGKTQTALKAVERMAARRVHMSVFRLDFLIRLSQIIDSRISSL